MNCGKFNSSLDEVNKLLKELRILKYGYYPRKSDYSEESRNLAKIANASFIDIYNTAVNNMDYEFSIFDDSLFQFYQRGDELRYAFIQSPLLPLTFIDFLRENFDEEDIPKDEDEINKLAVDYEDEFDQRLSERKLNERALYIRCDVDPGSYRLRTHPYAHLHFGLNQDFRIPVSYELTPMMFIISILKWVYPDIWETMLADRNILDDIMNTKDQCDAIPISCLTEDDRKDLILC